MNGVLLFNFFDGNSWIQLFNKIFLAPMVGLSWIIFFIEELFWALVIGFTDASGQQMNIVDVVLRGTMVQKIVLGIMIVASLLLIVFTMVGIIKQYTNTRDEVNNKQVMADTFKGLMLMLAIPLIVIGLVWLTNQFSNALVTYLGGGSSRTLEGSIANNLFVALGQWKEGLVSSHGVNFSMSLDDLVEKCYLNPNSITNYQYLIGYFVAFILFFNLGKATLLVGKRVFDIALLYSAAPLTASAYPLDKGSRWSSWMNIFLSKLLSTIALILCYFVYIALIDELRKALDVANVSISFSLVDGHLSNETIRYIIYVVILLTGGLAIGNAPSLIANLISDQAGRMMAEDTAAIDSDIKAGTAFAGATGVGAFAIGKGIVGNSAQSIAGAVSSSAMKNGNVEKAARAASFAAGIKTFRTESFQNKAKLRNAEASSHLMKNFKTTETDPKTGKTTVRDKSFGEILDSYNGNEKAMKKDLRNMRRYTGDSTFGAGFRDDLNGYLKGKTEAQTGTIGAKDKGNK